MYVDISDVVLLLLADSCFGQMAPPGMRLFGMVPVVVLFLFVMAPGMELLHVHIQMTLWLNHFHFLESVMLSSDVIREIGGEITDPVRESELYNDLSSELSVSTSTSVRGVCKNLLCNWSSSYNEMLYVKKHLS